MGTKSKLIVDDSTIYEVDLECFHCLSEEERWRYYGDTLRKKIEEQKEGAADWQLLFWERWWSGAKLAAKTATKSIVSTAAKEQEDPDDATAVTAVAKTASESIAASAAEE